MARPQPELADCRRRYEQQTGERVERNDTGAGYMTMSAACGQVDAFVRGVNAAGPELTRASFMDAMPRLGRWTLPGLGGTVTFAGKNHGAESTRRLVFVGGCRCWHADGEFRPVAP